MVKKGNKKKGEKVKTKTKKAEQLAVRESSPWNPIDMMRSLDEEFEEFRRNLEMSLWNHTRRRRHVLMTWPEFYSPKLEWAETKMPLMDIRDTGKELVIEAEMPGIPKENIDIQLTENSIEVCGEVKKEEKEEKEGYYRQERSYSTCYRQMPLPAEIIPSKADATLDKGILKIKLPKKEPTPEFETHTIKVK
jgi:HSP20 family protein